MRSTTPSTGPGSPTSWPHSTAYEPIDAAITAAAGLLADPVANRAALLAGIDARLDLVVERLAERRRSAAPARVGVAVRLAQRAVRRAAQPGHGPARPAGRPGRTALRRRWPRRPRCRAPPPTKNGSTCCAPPRPSCPSTLAAALDPGDAAHRGRRRSSRLHHQARRRSRDRARRRRTPAWPTGWTRCHGIFPMTAFDAEPAHLHRRGGLDRRLLVRPAGTAGVSARNDVAERIADATAALTAHDAALDAGGAPRGAADRGRGRDASARASGSSRLHPAGRRGAEQTAAHAHFTSGALLAHARPSSTTTTRSTPGSTGGAGAAEGAPARGRDDALGRPRPERRRARRPAVAAPARRAVAGAGLPEGGRPDSESLTYVAYAGAGHDPAGAALRTAARRLVRDDPGDRARRAGPAAHHRRRRSTSTGPARSRRRPCCCSRRRSGTAPGRGTTSCSGVVDTFDAGPAARRRARRSGQTAPLAQFLPATVASVDHQRPARSRPTTRW